MRRIAVALLLLTSPAIAEEAPRASAQPTVAARNLGAILEGLRGNSAAVETGVTLYAKECEDSQRRSIARISELEAKVKELQAQLPAAAPEVK